MRRLGGRGGIVLVLGGVDVGKSYLTGQLSARLSERTPTAVVDSDVGQSRIGPPTTVGWALAAPRRNDLALLKPLGIAFVGAVNPYHHLLPLAAATAAACARARRKARAVLVDTCGLIDGAARALWWNLHNLVGFKGAVAIQNGSELEPILAGLEGRDCWALRIAPAPKAGTKTAAERAKYRLARFEEYFRHARLTALPLENVTLQASHWGAVAGRIAALRNARGQDMALGIVARWDEAANMAALFAPKFNPDKVSRLVLGEVRPGLPLP